MSAKQGRILYGEANAQVLSSQKGLFEKAGYQVETAVGREAISNAMKRPDFALVILGHTLTRDDRHHLPYMAKKSNPAIRVLVLHSSGKHHEVDLAIDSRDGDVAVLQAVAQLLAAPSREKATLRPAMAFA